MCCMSIGGSAGFSCAETAFAASKLKRRNARQKQVPRRSAPRNDMSIEFFNRFSELLMVVLHAARNGGCGLAMSMITKMGSSQLGDAPDLATCGICGRKRYNLGA